MSKIKIVEHFLSIQGEGALSGRLSLFIRFAGCNLNCKGFGCVRIKNNKKLIGCDTLKAVYIDEFYDEYIDFDAKFFYEFLKKLDFKPMIVITGGEPMLWHKNTQFYDFIVWLLDNNYQVCFESNGTINLDFKKFPKYLECVFALSVKLELSGEKYEKRIKKEAILSYKNAKKVFYKFVLSKNDLNEQNLQNTLKQINQIRKICDYEIWCMPLGQTNEILKQNAISVFNFCIKYGFNYSDRLHIRLFDDKEGV